MAKRYPNPCRAKLHRNYTIPEAARALEVHKNTVSRWIKDHGLEAVTDRRPFLVRGDALRAFLTAKRAEHRVTCPPGHLYCLRCRAPREPAGGLVEYRPLSPTHGNLGASCAVCDTWMHRAIRLTDLPVFERLGEVLLPEA
ncbi:helix-turn-helix domain-containing protein [Thalassobaculum sp.]|uniref:helix-turn-helix domain-containing protein n=1 Tax=Thalassobaculum sp. TaxID=2022740 RepID=UPI0032EE7434